MHRRQRIAEPLIARVAGTDGIALEIDFEYRPDLGKNSATEFQLRDRIPVTTMRPNQASRTWRLLAPDLRTADT